MQFTDIVSTIRSSAGERAIAAVHANGPMPHIAVAPEHWHAVASCVAGHASIACDALTCLTGVDYPDRDQMCVVYHALSPRHGHGFCIKVLVPRDTPAVPSVADIWPAADWHEREAYDLFGIVFTGHPDSVTDERGTHPRRILLPDDWDGFPLRKDYAMPGGYHGIPGSVELTWARKPDSTIA